MNGRQYFEIADNSSAFLSVSILLIIIGVFVAIIGIVGTVGAILASSVFGRILLGLVSELSDWCLCIQAQWQVIAIYTVLTYFFDRTPRLLLFLLHISVWLLFEGGFYFFGKPADINDSWIRYVQAIQ